MIIEQKINGRLLAPVKKTETVIEIVSGPKWNGNLRRWEWTFFQHWWNNSPAYCGKCGRCTNPNNAEPCNHPEANRYVQAQIFISDLAATEKYILGMGNSVRYVRNGETIGDVEAKATT